MFLVIAWVVIIGVLSYYYLTKDYNYWKKKGIPFVKPTLFFGNVGNIMTLRVTVSEAMAKIYRNYEGHRYVGFYELRKPALLLRDPELIKHVLVKDFNSFQSNGIKVDKDKDPITENLSHVSGQKWRALRSKLNTIFTAIKMRNMFQDVAESSEELTRLMRQHADEGNDIEFRDVSLKYTTEVISTSLYGFKSNSIQDGDSEFRAQLRKVTDPTLKMTIKLRLRYYMPEVLKWLRICFVPLGVSTYFSKVIREVITHREENEVMRPDLLQTLMEIKDSEIRRNCIKFDGKGEEENASGEIKDATAISKIEVSAENNIVALAYHIYFAGCDPPSGVISFCLYELAANRDIQERLYYEIRSVLEKCSTPSFEAISEMGYLDRVVRETLRKYPPISVIIRECTETYLIPGTNITIEKGTHLIVPVYAIHHDPSFYEEPSKFEPDRFLKENTSLRHNFTFLPFSEGPRTCLGARFSMMEIKSVLVVLLRDYEVILSSKMDLPMKFDPGAVSLRTKSGVWVKLRHRRKKSFSE